MKTLVRFTFVCNRLNRTATAALISALENRVEDVSGSIRVVNPGEAVGIGFDQSGRVAEILCMSSMTASFAAVRKLLAVIRDRRSRVAFTSVCGGAHSSGDPLSVLEAGFDYCCVGEGEDVIGEIAECAAAGEGLDRIAGLFWLRDGDLKGRLRTEPVDLGRYSPLPRRMRFPTYIEIGRWCRWQCAYCQTPRIHSSEERFRSVREIEEVVSVYAPSGMKDFRLLLPNALGYASSKPRLPNIDGLERVLDSVKSRSKGGRVFLGSFPSEIRPDYVTPEAIRVLASHVSNTTLVIGGQSGSQRMLDLIGRGHSVEDIRRACDIVASCGFKPAVDMMLGLPGETFDDRQATLNLLDDLGRHGAAFNMHFFMPLPGTPLSRCQPVFLTAEERRGLDRLAQRGIVRGKWRSQEATARQWVRSRQEASPNP